jgi:hypothetical protein
MELITKRDRATRSCPNCFLEISADGSGGLSLGSIGSSVPARQPVNRAVSPFVACLEPIRGVFP